MKYFYYLLTIGTLSSAISIAARANCLNVEGEYSFDTFHESCVGIDIGDALDPDDTIISANVNSEYIPAHVTFKLKQTGCNQISMSATNGQGVVKEQLMMSSSSKPRASFKSDKITFRTREYKTTYMADFNVRSCRFNSSTFTIDGEGNLIVDYRTANCAYLFKTEKRYRICKFKRI